VRKVTDQHAQKKPPPGVGGRRSWSRDDKARIIAESFAARANVSAVARRYGLRPQQVYAWRRLAREGRLALPAEEEVGFVPVVTTDGQRPSAAPSSRAGVVEIEIGGRTLLYRATLATMESELGGRFVRIHRSRLVNRDAIRRIETNQSGDFEVLLSDGTTAKGSRRYRGGL